MQVITESIDPLNGQTFETCVSLLNRESIRRKHEGTVFTTVCSLIDYCLGLGYWWFPVMVYECRNTDGSLWKRFEVRNTLAGYKIAWGRYSEYYDDGTMSYEGLCYQSALTGNSRFRKHVYWLPDGTSVSQHEWMRFHFGPEIDACLDPRWET